jgi:hypothetical protein
MEIDEKCAPSKIYKDGSCLTLKSLKLIIESYNKNVKDIEKKIVISNNKSKMVKQLEEKFEINSAVFCEVFSMK